VRSYDEKNGIAIIEQRNRVFKGDKVEVLTPFGDNREINLLDMRAEDGTEIEVAPVAQMIFSIKTSEKLIVNDMLIKSRVVV